MILSDSLEYRSLPMQFYIFTFSGVWCPNNWKSPLKPLYNFYTAILATAGILFWLTMLINLVMTRNESEYFYENVFAISTLTYAMYKEYFILRKRKEIKNFLKLCFEDEWFKPRDVYEQEVIEKYEYETRFGETPIFITYRYRQTFKGPQNSISSEPYPYHGNLNTFIYKIVFYNLVIIKTECLRQT